jgi:DNA polymerase elongation subunit (family B)
VRSPVLLCPQLQKLITEVREFARVFGVDFFSVISRGSQFKVESFMFRIAKPESFVLRSPNKHEVTRPVLRELRILNVRISIGWVAKRGGVYALDNGANICLL